MIVTSAKPTTANTSHPFQAGFSFVSGTGWMAKEGSAGGTGEGGGGAGLDALCGGSAPNDGCSLNCELSGDTNPDSSNWELTPENWEPPFQSKSRAPVPYMTSSPAQPVPACPAPQSCRRPHRPPDQGR